MQGPVHILIKPASGRCNIACRYCFYRDVADHRETDDFGIMDDAVAALLVERAFELDAAAIGFGFQGGEPTVAGLPFFRRFVAMVRERAAALASAQPGKPVPRIEFSMQTNGVAITPEWAGFLKEEGFLLGVSLDGPRLLHDAYRVRRDGTGTHEAVLRGIGLLRDAGVPMNALCVVDEATADNAAAVYRFLRGRGFDWMQFIPCLDPLGEVPGGRPWSLTPAAYGRFLKEIFDLRYRDWKAGIPVNVRWVDNLVSMAMGYPPEICGMTGVCAVNWTVEADGSVYPCDFYVNEEWKLGDLRHDSFESMRQGAAARRFVETSRHMDPACATCRAYPLCRGGCRRDREPFADGAPTLNRYCDAYRDFFSHAGDRILEMAEMEGRR